MRLSQLLFAIFRLLLAPALISTVYLYLYPATHGCHFPEAKASQHASPEIAPFRLLALGDPQLEGDTSLPDPNAPLFPSLRAVGDSVKHGDVSGLKDAVETLVREDVVKVLKGYQKALDLWGNDLYLAHIYRSVSWWTQPTHTVVLGDLLGSQWIGDDEFQRRTERFWNRVFKGGERVPANVTDVSARVENLGNEGSWKNRIIAVAGNHDIGYAGDVHEHRIERFEDAYGRVNWDMYFRLDASQFGEPSALSQEQSKNRARKLHLIILNSMNLDDPALKAHLQQESRGFVDSQLHDAPSAATTGTILLTHIPFYKEAGVCVDAPFFSYFPSDQGGGIREQNHLSKHVSDHILNGLAKQSDKGQAIVLNGHDHEGCDTFHYRETSAESGTETAPWSAKHHRLSASEHANDSLIGVREITVRSMMGSFGGNAGLVSAWFDHEASIWRYEYDVCVLGVQHIWWAVHVLDLVVIGLGVASLLVPLLEALVERTEAGQGKVKKA